MEDRVVYVRHPSFFRHALGESFDRDLQEMGFQDMTPAGKDAQMLYLSMKYWCINFTKKVYVGTSKTYGNKSINMDEFYEQHRGKLKTTKFGI